MKKLIFWLFISLLFVGCVNSPQIIYDKSGYSKQGYNINGYDKSGFNENGYNSNGYNKLGFNSQGYNINGFSKFGFNKNGYDKNGFNENGYNSDGYNKLGFNSQGLTKKQVLKKEFDKLIQSKPTIKKVFHSILKKQEKDKYESDKEYKARIKNMNFTTYAIMNIDIRTEYDPNKKQYKIFFDTKAPYLSFKQKFNCGVINQFETKFNKEKLGKLILEHIDEKENYDSIGSNAFGHTVDVTNFRGISYIIYPNNLNAILNMHNIYTYKKKYYDDEKFYYIALNVNKKQAKLLDKEKLKLKVGIEFDNTLNLYKGVFVTSATIDSPTSMMFTNYLFKGKIKEFVLFTKDTKEILFHYAD